MLMPGVSPRGRGGWAQVELTDALQCLYENLMSNNFRRTAVLRKIWVVNGSYKT